MEIFDYKLLQLHRNRSAKQFTRYDFLVQEVITNIQDRLTEITKKFENVLVLGARNGSFPAPIGSKNFIQLDVSPTLLKLAHGKRVIASSEWLSFASSSFDLVVSILDLHSINDIPGFLIQVKKILKKEGLFIGAFFGGTTLAELRTVLTKSELEIRGGASPRISPFVSIQDAAALLQRAGFSRPVADSVKLTVTYENIIKLMHDLRYMGESNILIKRSKSGLNRKILALANEIYLKEFSDDESRLKASFEIITITGVN